MKDLEIPFEGNLFWLLVQYFGLEFKVYIVSKVPCLIDSYWTVLEGVFQVTFDKVVGYF